MPADTSGSNAGDGGDLRVEAAHAQVDLVSQLRHAEAAQRHLRSWLNGDFVTGPTSLRSHHVSLRERRALSEAVGLCAVSPGSAYGLDSAFVVVVVFKSQTPAEMRDHLPQSVDGIPVVSEAVERFANDEPPRRRRSNESAE